MAARACTHHQERSSNEWEFHPKYGIIHGWYCSTCRDYIAHLGRFYGQSNAIHKNPVSLYEIFYQDGLRDGLKFAKSQTASLVHELGRAKSENETMRAQYCFAQNKYEELSRQIAEDRANMNKDATNRAEQHSCPPKASRGEFSPQRPTPLPKTNPRLQDPVKVWYDYYCTHQKSWPRGVRCDSQRRPILSDLRADRAVACFRPDVPQVQRIDLSTRPLDITGLPVPSPRNQFKNLVVELFSQTGLYGERVDQLELRIAPTATYSPYIGPFPIALDDIVRHLAASGVSRGMASEDFEPWAQNYKAGVNCSIPFVPGSNLQNRRRR